MLSAVFDLVDSGLKKRGGLTVLGICGAQGSGKSTVAHAVLQQCTERAIPAAALSLDDLYLTKAERERLGREIHPLLRTRGVPGTHDVALGLEVLSGLARGEPVPLPRFDKADDDRAPPSAWPVAPAGCRVVVFEGWCVGARPQNADALHEPINALEALEDADGAWRRYANEALAGGYQRLFARIDKLALLAAPGFEVVFDWRMQQEEQLREASGPDASGVMDAAGVARFIQHYERLTRYILAEMPGRADLTIRLDRDRSPLAIERRS
ncbi:MAG: kinase [Novosphingobium sp.]|nr:kinase [Novosphingobium sp.]